MVCHKCRHTLSKESRFCQYCGTIVEEAAASSPETPSSLDTGAQGHDDRTPPVNQDLHFSKPLSRRTPTSVSETAVTRKRFCRLCGGEVDADTKRCRKCGKQYWKAPVMDTKMGLLALLTMVIALGLLCGVICFRYEKALLRAEQEILSQEETIAAMETELSELRTTASYGVLLEGADDFADFVIVQGTPGDDHSQQTYHRWYCERLDMEQSYYFAQAQSAALTPTLSACPYCGE